LCDSSLVIGASGGAALEADVRGVSIAGVELPEPVAGSLVPGLLEWWAIGGSPVSEGAVRARPGAVMHQGTGDRGRGFAMFGAFDPGPLGKPAARVM
jgi:hypothetical protein